VKLANPRSGYCLCVRDPGTEVSGSNGKRRSTWSGMIDDGHAVCVDAVK
jgi:hypothetical protein